MYGIIIWREPNYTHLTSHKSSDTNPPAMAKISKIFCPIIDKIVLSVGKAQSQVRWILMQRGHRIGLIAVDIRQYYWLGLLCISMLNGMIDTVICLPNTNSLRCLYVPSHLQRESHYWSMPSEGQQSVIVEWGGTCRLPCYRCHGIPSLLCMICRICLMLRNAKKYNQARTWHVQQSVDDCWLSSVFANENKKIWQQWGTECHHQAILGQPPLLILLPMIPAAVIINTR